MPSPVIPNSPPEIPTEGDDPPAEEPSMTPDSGESIQFTVPEHLLLSPDPLSAETGTVMPGMSPDGKALISLRRADEAKKPIERKNTWKGAVSGIKWVMDTVSPIAEVRAIPILPPRLSRLSLSAPPVCKDGIWPDFSHPRGASVCVIVGR